MRRALLLTLALTGACVPQSDRQPESALPQGTWRGDVSYPGLPAIGVQYVVDADGVRLIAARNMGFAGGPLDDFTVAGDSIRFGWSLNGDPYDCVLRRQDDGVYLGPCDNPTEPTFGMRMVPPGLDVRSGHARTMLEMSSVQWVSVAAADATTLWVAAEHRARVDGDSILAVIRRVRDDNATLMGDVARTLPLDVFFAGDRQQMERLVGRPVGGWTDPMSGSVALVGYGENVVALRHEATHAISFTAWGPPHDGAPWLGEGLATWVAGACRDYDIHELAADLHRRGELLPVASLIDDFLDQDDLIAYLQSGSVVGYLLDEHGVDAFRRVWAGGADALSSIGLSVAVLEREWLRYLESRPARPPFDWSRIRGKGCG